MRVALFTDTLGDVNGVSRFIRNAAEQARATGRELTVVTSTNFAVPEAANIRNVAPLFAMAMPKYPNLELVLPPARAMDALARELRPDVVHISTPGSVGMVGRWIAWRLGCPMVGVYHTDFPAYIEKLFQDDALTAVCTSFMRWFYRPFASLFTRSDEYAHALLRLGIQRERIHTLRPGIVLEQFHPRFRDASVLRRVLGHERGDASIVRAVYCGRVSVEKGLPALTRQWKAARERLVREGTRAQLLVIGDGPYRAEMERELAGHDALFLGFRGGEELSALYATSDFFVFPSTTDTLGQVVMESQASGLPVLVTDVGGPQGVVRSGETGYVLSASDDRAWIEAIVNLALSSEKRRAMGRAAHEFMQGFSMAASFEHYWDVHQHVHAGIVQSRPRG